MHMEIDEVEACSQTSEISASLNVPETFEYLLPQYWPDLICTNENWITYSRYQPETRKIRRRRKPTRFISVPQEYLPSTSTYGRPSNNPVTTHSNRRITTIHEGWVFRTIRRQISERQMQIHGKRTPFSISKAYKEKSAFGSALKKTDDNKRQMLQDSLPDETIERFSSINIK